MSVFLSQSVLATTYHSSVECKNKGEKLPLLLTNDPKSITARMFGKEISQLNGPFVSSPGPWLLVQWQMEKWTATNYSVSLLVLN